MTDKQTYIEKAEARMKQWDAEIDALKAKAQEAGADAKIEASERLEELKSQREAASQKLNELKASGDAAWEDTKDGFEGAWSRLSTALEKAQSRFQ